MNAYRTLAVMPENTKVAPVVTDAASAKALTLSVVTVQSKRTEKLLAKVERAAGRGHRSICVFCSYSEHEHASYPNIRESSEFQDGLKALGFRIRGSFWFPFVYTMKIEW